MTAASRSLLLLVVGDVPPARLHDALAEGHVVAARVHIVAPALVGAADWLAIAEDEARRQAAIRAFAAEWTLADAADVEGEPGDVDPVQAVEDALRAFPADEIVVAGDQADPDLEAALAGFGLPVRRIGRAPARRSRLYRALRELAGGHGGATPFLLFVGVNGAFLLFGILVSLLGLLILCLVGGL